MRKYRAITYVSVVVFLSTGLLSGAELSSTPKWRRPLLTELADLFNVAIRRPERVSVSAVIDYRRRPRTTEEMRKIKEKQDALPGRRSAKSDAANAKFLENISRGRRNEYIKEWYSKRFIRTDNYVELTDLKKPAPKSELSTVVELYDPSFSNYNRFNINYISGIATLNREPVTRNSRRNLWAASGMDAEFVALVVDALSDLTPTQAVEMARANFSGLEKVELSPSKAQLITDGLHKQWRIEAATEGENQAFRLRGAWHIGASIYQVDAVINLGKHRGNNIFHNGKFHNETTGEMLESQRANWDESGVPSEWNRSVTDSAKEIENQIIRIVTFESNVSLADAQIFGPPTPETHPDLTIFDSGGGRSERIAVGRSIAKLATRDKSVLDPNSRKLQIKRIIVISILAMPLLIAGSFYAMRRKQKRHP